MRRGRLLLVFLSGCNAGITPAVCREREARRYDPGPLTIAEPAQSIVRTIRCDGAFDDPKSQCTDDAPAPIRFTVTTRHGPPECPWDMRRGCWWGNDPASSHGDQPGTIDVEGTYSFSGIAHPSGGATKVTAHVGVASASTSVAVRLVLFENPGHLAPDVVERLSTTADAPVSLRIEGAADGAEWRTDQGDGKPVAYPSLGIDGRVTAARVHIESSSRTVAYDGYFAASSLVVSHAAWRAITRSTEQTDTLVVRVSAVIGGAVAASPEQRWRVDHGIFYQSPESLAQADIDKARTDAERAASEKEWIRTHEYITREEAIARAVRYLDDQGFTSAPPKGPLRRDIMEVQSDEDVRASRRGSVDPTPVATKKKAGGWWVAFRSVRGDPCRTRVIAVSADGKRLRMLHQDISLSSFD